jgi:hypothetical protein
MPIVRLQNRFGDARRLRLDPSDSKNQIRFPLARSHDIGSSEGGTIAVNLEIIARKVAGFWSFENTIDSRYQRIEVEQRPR